MLTNTGPTTSNSPMTYHSEATDCTTCLIKTKSFRRAMEALYKLIVYGKANQDNEIIRVNAVIIKKDEEGEEASPDVQART